MIVLNIHDLRIILIQPHPITFVSQIQGHGIICGNAGYSYDGYCVGAVANDVPNACATIFSEYAQPMLVKSLDTLHFLMSELETIYSYDLYKIGLTYSDVFEEFVWRDGTPLIYHNFREDVVGGDTFSNEKCVVLDKRELGVWHTFDCGTAFLEVASICQIG